MPVDVIILADDLTGAADTGIAFTLAGLRSWVAFRDDAEPPADVQVVAIDMDTRRLGRAAEAAARAGEVTRRALQGSPRALYKKIDSTLRGHVGVEAAATCRAFDPARGRKRPLLVASPAFPATGRIVRDGAVLVGGTLLEKTEVWQKSGMQGPANLPAMLHGAGLTAEVVRLPLVREGVDALHGILDAMAARGVDAAVCDAEGEDDLRRIAEAGARLGGQAVWMGSAGLARHLPAALSLRPAGQSSERAIPAAGPVLFLVGSRSAVARQQARRLEKGGVAMVVVAPAALLAGAGDPAWERAAAALEAATGRGGDAVAMISLDELVPLEQGPALASALARLAAPLVGRVGGVVATGGDIARALLAELGAGGLTLIGEVEPGVPMGRADGERPLTVVTKAGAFGTEDTLQRCLEALRRRGGS